MASKIKATFQVTGWDEKPIAEAEGKPKLTSAHVTCTFTGDVTGDGVADYLMVYPTSDTATFVGLQQIDGEIDGRKGSVVLEVNGKFEGGIASADWSVVTASATGKLEGISGKGGYASKSDGSADVTLDYKI
jgi:uncharacterized protein DUF3224